MLIVAAGQGTRLRPLTNEIPKCMVKFKNKSIIKYILDAAKNCGIKDIAIINGYKSEVLENYLKSEKVKKIKWSQRILLFLEVPAQLVKLCVLSFHKTTM